jgi:hypothetical protein
MISFVKDVFTLNFFSTPVEKESHKKNWKDYDHPETCQAIMQDILMMIEVYVSCWVNSKDFLGYVEFYENGIMPYRF